MTTRPRNGGSLLSGWCSAAPGARIVHTGCAFELCSCECHGKDES